MHGTFVQDRRLEKNLTCRLKDGDTVTFGIQVTRAQGMSTFDLPVVSEQRRSRHLEQLSKGDYSRVGVNGAVAG